MLRILPSAFLATAMALSGFHLVPSAAMASTLSSERAVAARPSHVQFERLPGYSKGQTKIANKIARKFAAAGFGRAQQIAAVSVAIRESTLNPKAYNRGCKCYGLFQLNRGNGLGTGHSAANLTDADYNIRLIIGEANRFKSFRNAGTVDAAVSAFVRHVTRPASKGSVIQATIRTARMVEKAASNRRFAGTP